jgi:hypothetical protein
LIIFIHTRIYTVKYGCSVESKIKISQRNLEPYDNNYNSVAPTNQRARKLLCLLLVFLTASTFSNTLFLNVDVLQLSFRVCVCVCLLDFYISKIEIFPIKYICI